MIQAFKWNQKTFDILDQTQLPFKKVIVKCRTYHEVIDAIRTMKVRGAPAIGIAAAYGVALASLHLKARDASDFLNKLSKVSAEIAASRPTAVNLFWALERMKKCVMNNPQRRITILQAELLKEAKVIEAEDVAINQTIGNTGAEFIRDGDTILTYCNTGALATGGYGTALGVIRSAYAKGKKIQVMVCETRPYLQGARLTAWELKEEGIPFTLITDNMAGHFMARKMIQVVAVGADRVAANGDVANKIGTYTLAVLAWEHRLPFYVVAPTSTIDMSVPTGEKIPIEQRDPAEVCSCLGKPTTPKGVKALHPAFDITPARFISALVTERGAVRAPYTDSLKRLMENSGDRIS